MLHPSDRLTSAAAFFGQHALRSGAGKRLTATEQRGLVSIVRINRPEKLNAISSAVAVELQQSLLAFDASDQRVAILSAAIERPFTSGADVTDLPEPMARHPHCWLRRHLRLVRGRRHRHGDDVRSGGFN
jgi:enoyl-CoA hydratase/carnithine racemase